MTVSHAIVILLILTCQLAPKSNSHISHPLLQLYKYQCNFYTVSQFNFVQQCIQISTRINSSSVHTYICVCFIRNTSNIQHRETPKLRSSFVLCLTKVPGLPSNHYAPPPENSLVLQKGTHYGWNIFEYEFFHIRIKLISRIQPKLKSNRFLWHPIQNNFLKLHCKFRMYKTRFNFKLK